MKKKTRERTGTPEAKTGKRAGTPEARKWGNWLRDIRKTRLTSPGKENPGISRQELAQRLGVDPSTVASWEYGDYKPSPESLIKLGNQIGFPEGVEAWKRAGLDLGKVKLWALPLAPKAFRLTFGLFPFQAGDVVGVDDSAIDDIWGLIGTLVVVEFSRYPERTEVDLSQRWLQRMREGPKVDLAGLAREEATTRQIQKEHSGLTAAEWEAIDHLQDARESELAKRWGPDRHGTIELRHIQAGWLRLRLAGDSDLTISSRDPAGWALTNDPWQLVLEGASVKGITLGSRVPLFPVNGWERRPKGRNIRLRGMRILGRVSSWERVESSVLPDEVAATKLRAQAARNKPSEVEETP